MFVIALYSFSISKEKKVFSSVTSKLAKKDIERFHSASIKATIIRKIFETNSSFYVK